MKIIPHMMLILLFSPLVAIAQSDTLVTNLPVPNNLGQREIDFIGSDIYVGFTNNSNQAEVAKYSGGSWSFSGPLLQAIGIEDSAHNDTEIAIDGDNRIHLWSGMHDHKMTYARSVNAGNIGSFNTWNRATASEGTPQIPTVAGYHHTYPEAAAAPNGDIYFISRNGPGATDNHRNLNTLYRWNDSSNQWSAIATVFSGLPSDGQVDGSQYTAYNPTVHVDPTGQVHIVMLWKRGTAGPQKHQGTYVRYNPSNGNFYKADGSTASLPITTQDDDSVFVFQPRISNWTQYGMNDPTLTTDGNNRPVILYNFSTDGTTNTSKLRHRVARWNGSSWVRTDLNSSLGAIWYQHAITYDNGVLRAYCRTASPSGTLVRTSTDNGATFPHSKQVSWRIMKAKPFGTHEDRVITVSNDIRAVDFSGFGGGNPLLGVKKIINRQSGLALKSTGTADYANVIIQNYNGVSAKKWNITVAETSGGKTYYRLSPQNATGMALRAEGTSDYSSVIQRTWNNWQSQKFEILKTTTAGGKDYYRIVPKVNDSNQYCLRAASGATNVVLRPFNSGWLTEQWSIENP